MKTVNLAAKLAQFSTHWDPHVVADYNDNDVMVVKFQGEFPFHLHEDTDDFFLVLEGEMVMELEDAQHHVGAGELFIVPRGVTHRPRAAAECKVLLIEPKGVPNTGDPATAAPKPRI
ncbi:cupin domain-containing protein [Pseudosulfitobacter pseudonitzschiae]|uniref:cupin domain-containing protein n=1 Tax=Pseudosulfitobacter pseudonitzschiae TaxID=1402135 RepID=UPI001AF697A1|nr:cupin domain-containing protein [Pseudosulfitobacter pseudonitzschiae]MBM1815577.1 cupin domain-containing protein [Pseudosulfitobacter pseudonitzschiae]MBM1832568.1 cupin domain-containing protein [Pseudosulfitobacter pseudonitzschiae]MBM1837436.1 cupin domain-containing protein [Pseudosulfitobacter pseudonitzschiae]MBM1842282.1 cupin domain-containing protein [Pseudosulfitobacter pseudonitzschiae]MBM1847150.1 cupin domain-containing protein [Pseudosulfitobacter pseudonitzschiae]